MDDSSHYNEKSNYKLIKFVKPTTSKSSNSQLLEDLYEDLPPATTQTTWNQTNLKSRSFQDNSSPRPQLITTKKSPPVSSSITSSKHSLFKAIHNNDLEYLKTYLGQGFDAFVEDDFKWNVLMVAVASRSNDLISYFLENVEDKKRVLELIENEDAGGNSAESLTNRFGNEKALKIFNEFKSDYFTKRKVKNEPSLAEQQQKPPEAKLESKYWCDECNQEFNQTQTEHLKSILHQLNEKERPLSETSGRYHLRSDNKGYQLLVKSGWNETSGLGANEQGVKNPIKGKVKLNRKGIGVPSDDKKFQNVSLKSLKLRKNESSGNDGASLRAYKKSKQKLKIKERNLRRYFDS